jgi:DnaK suppressor protein
VSGRGPDPVAGQAVTIWLVSPPPTDRHPRGRPDPGIPPAGRAPREVDVPLARSRAAEDEGIRARLEERRRTLEEEVRTLSEHDPAESANLQFGKRIGDGTAYAIDRMTGAYQARTLYQTIVQIDAALDRLRDGTYGTCQGCGAAIPAERLEAVPWAALCVGCASRPAPRR